MLFPFARIRHLLIDLDGVLYRGNTPLPAAADFIAWLRKRGISYRLVTNNATLTQAQYVKKLAAMHIEAAPDDVFTSALATSLYLRRESQPGDTAYVIGEDGLLEGVASAGLVVSAEQPDFVVVGLDRFVTYEKIALACLAIRGGARFIGTNPDTSFPSERGLLPGAGAIQASLEAATGVRPTVIGKPEPLMLQLAMEHLGGTPTDTVMLGDRLDTDIMGAHAAGVQSILVLTGVSTRAEAAASEQPPALVVEDLIELMKCWSPDARQEDSSAIPLSHD